MTFTIIMATLTTIGLYIYIYTQYYVGHKPLDVRRSSAGIEVPRSEKINLEATSTQ